MTAEGSEAHGEDHTTTLGTTGTTRKETLDTLQQVGLTLPHAQKTMNKLHKTPLTAYRTS